MFSRYAFQFLRQARREVANFLRAVELLNRWACFIRRQFENVASFAPFAWLLVMPAFALAQTYPPDDNLSPYTQRFLPAPPAAEQTLPPVVPTSLPAVPDLPTFLTQQQPVPRSA